MNTRRAIVIKAIVACGVAVCSLLAAQADRIDLKTKYASCSVETDGARVMSFKGPDGEEAIWNANPVQMTDAKWAHGGIPVCWPWFGEEGHADIHGTAWRRPFAVVSRTEGKDRCELVLRRDEGDIKLEYTLVLRDTLKLELKTTNRGKSDFSFSAAFHPYFRVGERDRTEVAGVKKTPIPITHALDDIYPAKPGRSVYCLHDHSIDRTFVLFFENPTIVNIWNPGAEKNCPGTIPGDEWRRFVCVEPALGEAASPVTLKPGDSVSLMMDVDVRRGSKASGGAGKDPRGASAYAPPRR